METVTYTLSTDSDQETIRLGRKLGALLDRGDVVALIGELGSGKTWFTKGLALGLGVGKETVVTSPSFALVNEYQGRTLFYHIDAYRLGDLSDFLAAGLEEYLQGRGVVAMEWADRWPEILPAGSLWATLRIIDDHRREITLKADAPRAREILETFKRQMIRG